MTNYKIFFKNHWAALVLAFLVGVVVVFPQVLFIYEAGDQYQGFNIFETDSEYYYMARIREVYDGHYRIANPVFSHGKDLPYVHPPLPELIMGLTGKIFHLSIDQVLILYRFFAPISIFLLIYFLVLKIANGDKKPAILSAALVILALNLVSYPQDLLKMFQGIFHAQQFADFARPINPQISSLLFFSFLYAFWQLLKTAKWRYFILSLILYGLSIYIYIYTWVFLTIFLGLWLVMLFLVRVVPSISAVTNPPLRGSPPDTALGDIPESLHNQKKSNLVKNISLIILGGLIMSVQYFINALKTLQHPGYRLLEFGHGLVSNHNFVMSSVLAVALLLLLSTNYLKKLNKVVISSVVEKSPANSDRHSSKISPLVQTSSGLDRDDNKKLFWFLFILILSGFIAINQQVITGRVLQYGHFHWFFNKPTLIIIFSIFIFSLLEKLKFKKVYLNILLIIAIALAFFNTYNIQIASYKYHFNKYLHIQKYRPVIDWLNLNTKKEEVVYVPQSLRYPIPRRSEENISSRLLGRFITSYTPLNMYYFNRAAVTLHKYPNYVEDNLFLTLKLLNIKPAQAFDYLRNNLDIFADVYFMYFKVRGLNFTDIPDKWIQDLAVSYQNFYKQSWPEIFSKYPMDYIIWDKDDLPDLPFEDIKDKSRTFFLESTPHGKQNLRQKVRDKHQLFEEIYNQAGVVIYRL